MKIEEAKLIYQIGTETDGYLNSIARVESPSGVFELTISADDALKIKQFLASLMNEQNDKVRMRPTLNFGSHYQPVLRK